MADTTNPVLIRRRFLQTTAGALAGGALVTTALASEHDVDVSFGSATAAPGESIDIPLDIDPANDPDAEVGAYDIELTYDDSVLSFVEANGVDLADPTVSEPEDGTVVATATGTTGTVVPLTAATFTFDVESDADGGDTADIELVDAESEFTDPVNDVTFESQSGTVTVADGPFFDVTITETNEPVDEGSNLLVFIAVENTGSDSDTQTVELLDFGGETVDSETITLTAGETEATGLNWETESGDAGVGEVTVESDDDDASKTVEIVEVPDVRATMPDATGKPGEEVLLPFAVAGKGDDDAEVGAYDIEFIYDESILSFVELVGQDLPDPTVSEPEPGTIKATASDNEGVPVSMTAALFTFELDEDAEDEETATVEFVPDESELTDPVDEVTAEFDDGTITVQESVPIVEFRVGDATTSGDIGIIDAVKIQQYLAGVLDDDADFSEELADVNRSGEIEIIDAVLIQQYLAGVAERGWLGVEDIRIEESVSDTAVERVERVGKRTDSDDYKQILVEFENTGDLGVLQEVELRIAEESDDLPDEEPLVSPTIDIEPTSKLSVLFVVPADELDENDWVGIYSDDDSKEVAFW